MGVTPSLGGTCAGPRAAKYATAEDESDRIGHLKVSFDGGVLAEDVRWRETVVELFTSVAAATGAFYAAAQVETGWIVSANNRIWADAGTDTGEHFLRGRLWQGLPPIPVWLSWFGAPYRDLVADELARLLDADAKPATPTGWRRLFKARAEAPPPVHVVARGDGIVVRLSDPALPQSELPPLALPRELTYRHRPRSIEKHGAVDHFPANRAHRAEVVPSLET